MVISFVAGLFTYIIGSIGEGSAPMPFIWYALLVIFFGFPIIMLISIAKNEKKK